MSNSSNSRRKIVITGVGLISPIGIGVDAFWNSLQTKRSGVSKVELLSATALPGHVAGEVKDFTEESAKKLYFTRDQKKSAKVMCREIQLGVAAANLAIENCGIDLTATDHNRLGVEFGANQMFSPPEDLSDGCWRASDNYDFQFNEWGPKGFGGMQPLWLLKYLPNMPACHIGIHADAQGPNNSLTMAEASGNAALGEALRIIERDRADIMLAGTCGVRIHPVKALHATLWDRLADFPDAEPSTWSRPFDATRKGQVVGEGACVFILEEEQHAKARGAKIMGQVMGAASSCAIERSGKPNFKQALVNALRGALRDAGVSPDEVGHINAHGLSDQLIDAEEAAALQEVFGSRLASIPVTAPKSFLGNSGAASGTLELAASLIAMQNGVLPTTLNYKNPDPACPLNIVSGDSPSVTNKVFVSLSVTNAAQASVVVACGA